MSYLDFNSLAQIHLSNQHLTIRRYSDNDFFSLKEQFDPKLFKWMPIPYAKCEDFVQDKLNKFNRYESVTYVVIDNHTNKVIGTFSLIDIDFESKRIEIGSVWFGEQFIGKFYNAMTQFLILQFLFEQLRFNRVQWKTDKLNERSQMAARSLGFIYEGTLRKYGIIQKSGRIRDTVIFSLIDDDWAQAKKTILNKIAIKLQNTSHF